MVLGDPGIVEPGRLGRHHHVGSPAQRLTVSLTREPARQQEHSATHHDTPGPATAIERASLRQGVSVL